MNDSNRHDRIAKVNPFFIPANNHELFFINNPSFLSTALKNEDEATSLDNEGQIRPKLKI